MTQHPSSSHELPEVAFYYPGPVWYSADWIKNLILFFDGIALLVPAYMKDRPEEADPAIALALKKKGLLHILEPESLVDAQATKQLESAMMNILKSGALDHLAKEKTPFHELSYSRLGGYGDERIAHRILKRLKTRGLAQDTEDGVSIPMHPLVRSLILVLLAQILRTRGESLGLDLSPATDRPVVVDALTEVLSLPTSPSVGRVVAFDLESVGVDLSSVPIDEILGFRDENRDLHRRYARSLRKFVRDLSMLTQGERSEEFEGRQEELSEIAGDLKRVSRKAWRRPASFALTAAGAAWTATTGNPIGALVGIGSAILGATPGEKAETGAYSYIFAAKNRFPY